MLKKNKHILELRYQSLKKIIITFGKINPFINEIIKPKKQ